MKGSERQERSDIDIEMPADAVLGRHAQDAFALAQILRHPIGSGNRMSRQSPDGHQTFVRRKLLERGQFDVAGIRPFVFHEFRQFRRICAEKFREGFYSQLVRSRIEGIHMLGKAFAIHPGIQVVDFAFENDEVCDAHVLMC